MSLDTTFGLPTHVLVIHAVIVLVPLASVGVILYAAIPAWRSVLRWPVLVVATLGAAAAPVAYLSGNQLRDRLGLSADVIQRHADFGLRTMIVVLVWWVVCALLLAGRSRWKDPAILVVAAVLMSVAAIVGVVFTGHSGSDAVWGTIVENT